MCWLVVETGDVPYVLKLASSNLTGCIAGDTVIVCWEGSVNSTATFSATVLIVSLWQEGPGFNSQLGQTFPSGVCMFSLCLCGFSLGAPVSPTVKTCTISLSPVSTLDRGTGLESGVGPQELCCGCPLLLRDQLMQWTDFTVRCVYVTNKVLILLQQTK